MNKQIFKTLLCLVLLVAVAGCSAKTYTVRRQREDQQIEGNAGYLQGTPPPVDHSDVKKTRKVYVLEIQSKADARQEQEVVQMIEETEEAVEDVRRDLQQKMRQAPEEPKPVPKKQAVKVKPLIPKQETTGFQEYIVGKNDTLQKISMKFYNTNHKWTKIFEANKDALKDPNRIKPGMVLQIPLE